MASPRRTITVAIDSLGVPRARGVPTVQYRVSSGPDRSKQLETAADRVHVGTAEANALRLTDGTVSATHAEFFFDAEGLRVRDLGSKNGIFLDGHRVYDAAVPSGTTLVLGKTTLKVKVLEQQVESSLSGELGLGGLVGSSLAMRVLFAQLRKAAASDASVLIQGASGTGKELAAEALVSVSHRKGNPFVVMDCRALNEGLIESELFGHEVGAFTGAVRQHAGVFERANGGTLLLDEVGELSPVTQAKLLGVLQRGSFRRLGGVDEVKVDVRVICTTALELRRLINQGSFRADLYFRLAALEVRVPGLDERREDLPALVAHFLDQLQPRPVLSARVMSELCSREYAGHVRELASAVERAALSLDVATAPAAPVREVNLEVPYGRQRQALLDGFERAYVVALLAASGGNVSAAARRGGMNRVHLHQLINRLGLSGHV